MYNSQVELYSFVVSADASAVFYVTDKTRLTQWLVGDSDIAMETDLSAALPTLTDPGDSSGQNGR